MICDECTMLCLDVLDVEEGEGTETEDGQYKKFHLSVALQTPLSEEELLNLPGIIKNVEKAFPGCRVSVLRLHNTSENAALTLSVVSPSNYDVKTLREEIKALTLKLRIVEQKLLTQLDVQESLERRISEYERYIASKSIEELKESGNWPGYTRSNLLMVFLDVAGFSTMSSDRRARTVELLRGVAGMLVRAQEGLYVNTWGDAIVVCFRDAKRGLECACLFVQQLGLLGIEARVGVAWGSVFVRANHLIGREDIEGDAVNLAARLEALAEPGEVLCSEEIRHLDGVWEDDFTFMVVQRTLKKAVGPMPAGSLVDVITARLRRNVVAIPDDTVIDYPAS
jgi:class 3 adenylate cyclase